MVAAIVQQVWHKVRTGIETANERRQGEMVHHLDGL